MHSIAKLQATRNANTRGGWECFAPHRERVTQLLIRAATANASKLCVLGAGNCNDLDLRRLAESYGNMELVDIDGDSVEAGIAGQHAETLNVNALGGVDVTGVAEILATWDPSVPARGEDVLSCIEKSQASQSSLPKQKYDTVASVCLLSQLLESVTLQLGESHPQYLQLLTSIRREHVRLLIDLARPGGAVVLVTDIVSSATLPELDSASTTDLPNLVRSALEQRNFFTGMNPAVITNLLRTEETFATRLADVKVTNPWVWDLGPRRYAVCAFTATRV